MWDTKDVISQDPSLDYKFQFMRFFSDPLSRQLDESVRIAMVHNYGKVLARRDSDPQEER